MNLVIDSSNNTSDGGKRYLNGLIYNFNPRISKFNKIIIWGPSNFLASFPERSFLIKKTHYLLNKGFLHKILWNIFFKEESLKLECDILLCPYGNYLGNIKPYVCVSQNMLYFENKERARFGYSFLRFKLKLLSELQKKSIKNSNGIIFLSNYAKNKISSSLKIENIFSKVINFGIGSDFMKPPKKQKSLNSYSFEQPFSFLYVSTVFPYKHHCNVVNAISRLRKKGYPISLKLIGQGDKNSMSLLSKCIKFNDPKCLYIDWIKNVDSNSIKNYYHSADAFLFASSCENMPNILIEAMSSGLPIVSSYYNPMKEFLLNNAFYFDPISVDDIEFQIQYLLQSPQKRQLFSQNNFINVEKYDWKLCSKETILFLEKVKTQNK